MSSAAAGSTHVCRTTAQPHGQLRPSDLWSRTCVQFDSAARDETWAVLAPWSRTRWERTRYSAPHPRWAAQAAIAAVAQHRRAGPRS